MTALVKTSDKNHIIRILGSLYSRSYKFLRRTFISQILTCINPVVRTSHISYITTLPYYFSLVSECILETLARIDLICSLEVRAAAAHST